MRPVLLGRIHGLFGVRGWLKVYSYTDPPANILDYPQWLVRPSGACDWSPMTLAAARRHGKALIAHLAPAHGQPLPDRNAAATLLGADIAVNRTHLPALPHGEVYWADLLDCRVVSVAGQYLGRVTDMMDAGAHPVMVVTGEYEHLIPLVRGAIVHGIDTERGLVTVDWESDFL